MRSAPLFLVTIALLCLWSACAASTSNRPPAPDPKAEFASQQMAMIDQEIQIYYLDRGRLPTSLGQLPVDVPADPWGSRYLYETGIQRHNSRAQSDATKITLGHEKQRTVGETDDLSLYGGALIGNDSAAAADRSLTADGFQLDADHSHQRTLFAQRCGRKIIRQVRKL